MLLQPNLTVRSVDGMVCAVDHLAAQAGLAMLRAGGNAVDAAIATNAVLAVTTQNQCGMGGDLFAVVSVPGTQPIALNASGFAGAKAHADGVRADGHTVMPLRDHIATVTMPGCVDGWMALHKRYGSLSMAEILAPAQRYATSGFPASPSLAQDVIEISHLSEAGDYTEIGALHPGAIVQRPGVARVLEAIVKDGRIGFYEGEFGEGLLGLPGSPFIQEDLSRPISSWVPALRARAWGHDLWTTPPNSQGYLTLAGTAIASGLSIPHDPTDPNWAHLLIESARQAAFDRIDVLHEDADGWALIDEERLAPRRAAIRSDSTADLGDSYRDGGTTALMVVDKRRMGISIVQSNASGFGARIAVPGVRIFLHNRGMGFSLEAGHPAELRAGSRPPHTLCPTVVTHPDGSLAAVLGTAGGDSQPQFLLQILARVLVSGMDPGDAIAAGRWSLGHPNGGQFNTWRAGGAVEVMLEGNTPKSWPTALVGLGHDQLEVHNAYSPTFGLAHLIVVEPQHIAGATDPRSRFGAAVGF